MPVILDRKQSAAATSAVRRQPGHNRVLIFGCIAAIVLCWAFIAVQVFGVGFARSSRPAAPASLPAGIKIMPQDGK